MWLPSWNFLLLSDGCMEIIKQLQFYQKVWSPLPAGLPVSPGFMNDDVGSPLSYLKNTGQYTCFFYLQRVVYWTKITELSWWMSEDLKSEPFFPQSNAVIILPHKNQEPNLPWSNFLALFQIKQVTLKTNKQCFCSVMKYISDMFSFS